MLPLPDLEVVRPRSLAEAIDAIAAPDSLLLAGGTDVLPNLKRGLHHGTRTLVSVRRVAETTRVDLESDGSLVIGAGVTLARIASHALVGARYPALARAASLAASPQIRTTATIGGNVCLDTRCPWYDQSAFWRAALGGCIKTGDDECRVVEGGRRCVAAFSADTPGPLLAYGASVRLASARGLRTVPLASFFTADGARNTVRARDEILTHVRIPAPDGTLRSAYVKVRPRRAIDFPALSIAVAVTSDRTTIVVGALDSRPRVFHDVQDLARCRPLDNIGVDADWRRAVLPVFARRALDALVDSRS